MERQTQKRLVSYLRKKGCYVINTRPGPGTPTGCPDVLALYEGWWGAFEIKRKENAPFQPLQKDTLDKLDRWSMAWVVHPENLDEVMAELDKIL